MKSNKGIREQVIENRRQSSNKLLGSGDLQGEELVTFKNAMLKIPENEKALILELQFRIDEQRKELEQRSATVQSLQRNFETLSNFCRSEKSLNKTLTREQEILRKEYSNSIGKLADVEKEKSKLIFELDNKNKQIDRISNVEEKYTILKHDHEDIVKKYRNKIKESEGLEGAIRVLKLKIQNLKKSISELKEALMKAQNECVQANNQTQKHKVS